MKTRIPMLLAQLLLAMLFGHKAQAFYNPQTGRWLSRDPIEEQGGLNNHGFVLGNPVTSIDLLGFCCVVEKLEITSATWIGQWPSQNGPVPYYAMQLAVDFLLKLAPGSDIRDCRVRQFMRGMVTYTDHLEYYPNWTQDGPPWWWDGQRWAAGRGMSSEGWKGLTAIFHDKPGFVGLTGSDFPIYMGVARIPPEPLNPEFFDFSTEVRDISEHPELGGRPRAEILWGMSVIADAPSRVGRANYISSTIYW